MVALGDIDELEPIDGDVFFGFVVVDADDTPTGLRKRKRSGAADAATNTGDKDVALAHVGNDSVITFEMLAGAVRRWLR